MPSESPAKRRIPLRAGNVARVAGMTKRQQRQLETRAALLDAAERCFAERGYDAVSVPEIAREAGYTTGAVYSNFTGKEELFLALMERAMGGEAARRSDTVAQEGETRAQLRGVARLWIELVRQRPEAMVLLVEFWSYSRRRPELRREFAERMATTRAGMAALIDAQSGAAPDAAAPEDLALAAYALGHGMALHHLADPEGVPIEKLEAAILWLFRGAGRDPG